MASTAQIQANRLNARNALKHGMLARENVQTNPIWPERNESQVFYGKELRSGSPPDRPGKNKANFRRGRVGGGPGPRGVESFPRSSPRDDCAKQSQTWAGRSIWARGPCLKTCMTTAICRVAGVPPARVERVPPSIRGPEALGTRGQDVRDTFSYTFGDGPDRERNAPNKTPTTKVPESGFDPGFWANTKDQIGKSGLLSGASNKPNLVRSKARGK